MSNKCLNCRSTYVGVNGLLEALEEEREVVPLTSGIMPPVVSTTFQVVITKFSRDIFGASLCRGQRGMQETAIERPS